MVEVCSSLMCNNSVYSAGDLFFCFLSKVAAAFFFFSNAFFFCIGVIFFRFFFGVSDAAFFGEVLVHVPLIITDSFDVYFHTDLILYLFFNSLITSDVTRAIIFSSSFSEVAFISSTNKFSLNVTFLAMCV